MAEQCEAICAKTGVRCGLPSGHHGKHQNGDRNMNWQAHTGNTWDDSESKDPAPTRRKQ